ncbi:MAG: ParB/RepB/Spo0J family partition protein [Candidatus Hydrogenedentota bacterium]
MINKGFGRGIQTLLGEFKDKDSPKEDIVTVSIGNVLPNPYQPRKIFNEEELKELADSIKVNGLLQPLIVRKQGDTFELVAGERRLRAASIAGIKEVPCKILDINDEKMLEISIIENIQREDLNPIDEAFAYERLTNEFNRTHDEISKIISKSRSHITNTIRLLNLPEEVKAYIKEGRITKGHARSLLAIEDHAKIIEIANNIINNQLSVRSLEDIVYPKEKRRKKDKDKIELSKTKDPNILSLEEEIMKIFGTGVRIIRGKNKGSIEIDFYSDDDLDRIVNLIRTL